MSAALTLDPRVVRKLEDLARDPSTHRRRAARIQIVLQAAAGISNREIAETTGVSVPTVILWRNRYAQLGLAGLDDRPRLGRPSRVGAPPATEPITNLEQQEVPPAVQRVLDAASRVISRRGFARTRVADIAAEARVAPATVHYHFKTRAEILIRSLLWSNQRALARLERVTRGEDPIVRLAKFIERSIPYPGSQRDEYLLEIELWSVARVHTELLPAYESYTERWVDHVVHILEEGIAEGYFEAPAGARETAERLVALTDGLSPHAAIGSARMPPERLRQLVYRFAASQLGLDADRLQRSHPRRGR